MQNHDKAVNLFKIKANKNKRKTLQRERDRAIEY